MSISADLAQDALVAALKQWPEQGVPDNPGACLMAAGKHRAIDRLRRNMLQERKHEEIVRELEDETFAKDLSSFAECARRPTGQTRPQQRSPRRV